VALGILFKTHIGFSRISPESGTFGTHKEAVNKKKTRKQEAYSITQLCRETVAPMTSIHSHTKGLQGFLLCLGPSKQIKIQKKLKKGKTKGLLNHSGMS
jgi:hypothetical protein